MLEKTNIDDEFPYDKSFCKNGAFKVLKVKVNSHNNRKSKFAYENEAEGNLSFHWVLNLYLYDVRNMYLFLIENGNPVEKTVPQLPNRAFTVIKYLRNIAKRKTVTYFCNYNRKINTCSFFIINKFDTYVVFFTFNLEQIKLKK